MKLEEMYESGKEVLVRWHFPEDDEDMEEDLDLESVIKELESELDEAEENDDKEEVEEQSKSSGIGAGDNKVSNASRVCICGIDQMNTVISCW